NPSARALLYDQIWTCLGPTKAFSRYVINDVQHAEPAASGKLAMNKVEAQRASTGGRVRFSITRLRPLRRRRQTFIAIYKRCVFLWLIITPSRRSRLCNRHRSCAKARGLHSKLRIITAARAIAYAHAIRSNHPALPPLADLKQSLKMPHCFPF